MPHHAVKPMNPISVPAVRVLLTMAAVAMLGGCATKGDVRDLRTEIRVMAVRQDSLIAELRRQTMSTQDTLREASDQLFNFRGDISRRLQAISQSLSTMESIVGENQRGIVGIRDQLANMRRMPGGQPAGGAGPTGEDPMMGPGDAPGQRSDSGPVETYNAAVGQFNRGSLTTARLAFEQFLQAYPNHRLAPDAHYYLADLMVQEDRLEDALDAFREIPELFPSAEKVPEALYRIALLQIELDRTGEAENTLERIVNSYPDAGVALLAREKLNEIR